MRQIAVLGAFGIIIGGIASGCGSTRSVIVTLSNTSFGTSGGNLFNCSTPDRPANQHALTTDTIECEPKRNPDGSFATTPVVVTQQVGCGDGHGALVTVTCAGNGIGNMVTGTVELSLTSSCGSKDVGANPQTFAFQDLAPAAEQTSQGAVDSCSEFDNLCGTSNPCAFNSFAAEISVTNLGR